VQGKIANRDSSIGLLSTIGQSYYPSTQNSQYGFTLRRPFPIVTKPLFVCLDLHEIQKIHVRKKMIIFNMIDKKKLLLRSCKIMQAHGSILFLFFSVNIESRKKHQCDRGPYISQVKKMYPDTRNKFLGTASASVQTLEFDLGVKRLGDPAGVVINVGRKNSEILTEGRNGKNSSDDSISR